MKIQLDFFNMLVIYAVIDSLPLWGGVDSRAFYL